MELIKDFEKFMRQMQDRTQLEGVLKKVINNKMETHYELFESRKNYLLKMDNKIVGALEHEIFTNTTLLILGVCDKDMKNMIFAKYPKPLLNVYYFKRNNMQLTYCYAKNNSIIPEELNLFIAWTYDKDALRKLTTQKDNLSNLVLIKQ